MHADLLVPEQVPVWVRRERLWLTGTRSCPGDATGRWAQLNDFGRCLPFGFFVPSVFCDSRDRFSLRDEI